MSRALRLRELAQITDGSLLDLAVITPDGLDSWKAETANTCNNGHSTIKLFVSICIGMLWDAGVLDLQEKAAALFPACWTAEMELKSIVFLSIEVFSFRSRMPSRKSGTFDQI